MSKDEKKTPKPGKRLQIQLSPNLEPIYANFALITHSHSEIVIDFAQAMPQMTQARVKARIVMTPLNAKLLLRALSGTLKRYEDSHGKIEIPEGPSLADQLFKPFRQEPPPDKEE
jgi:hypothetical protein